MDCILYYMLHYCLLHTVATLSAIFITMFTIWYILLILYFAYFVHIAYNWYLNTYIIMFKFLFCTFCLQQLFEYCCLFINILFFIVLLLALPFTDIGIDFVNISLAFIGLCTCIVHCLVV